MAVMKWCDGQITSSENSPVSKFIVPYWGIESTMAKAGVPVRQPYAIVNFIPPVMSGTMNWASVILVPGVETAQAVSPHLGVPVKCQIIHHY
jgi:hypothetical protein